MEELLKIKNLQVVFPSYGKAIKAVQGISFTIKKGEILALVGESGCGKSVTAKTILRLNQASSAKISADEMCFMGIDLQQISEHEMEEIRGAKVAMIFQDPMTCLNPTMQIGKQITERLYRKNHESSQQCHEEAIRLLELVQMPDAAQRAKQYPHQLSGGMRQRVMIAMALACKPDLLIADEPTTALDVTTQLQILKILANIRNEMNMAILLITHDFGVVANLADRVAVMVSGKIVETASTQTVFEHPEHPYTVQLLESLPQPGKKYSPHGEFSHRLEASCGCCYSLSCPSCMKICLNRQPEEFTVQPGHTVFCWKQHPLFLKEQ